MKTLGVDLAAATKKTAAAVIEWSPGSAQLMHLALGVDDQAIVDLFGSADMTGVDCPVGWPGTGTASRPRTICLTPSSLPSPPVPLPAG
jgi:predicted nuclease with RNAse H fold